MENVAQLRPENNHKSRQQDQSRTLAESSLFMAFHTQLVNAPISIVLRLKKLFVYLTQTLEQYRISGKPFIDRSQQ